MWNIRLAVLICLAATAVIAQTAVTPIPSMPTNLPDFIGTPAKAWPVANSRVPQNPFLAPNPLGGVHLDGWNSDTADIAGPLGRDPVVWTSMISPPRQYPNVPMGSTQAFDSHGRPVVICLNMYDTVLVLLDPVSLETLTSYPLTPANGAAALGSAYFYVDSQDQVVISNGPNQVITLREGGTEAEPVFEPVPEMTYDLSEVVQPGDRLGGLMVDWQGRIWFDTRGEVGSDAKGIKPIRPRVGVIDPATYPDVTYLELPEGEQISNTLAVTKVSAFVVSSLKMYEISAGADNQPYVVWSAPYETTGGLKPGQYSLGSGTSPTILGNGKYVAIADNAQQTHVVVYRTGARLGPNETRRVGDPMPVFENGAGAVENSLLCYGNSIIVENVYGYRVSPPCQTCTDPPRWTTSPSLPGFERIDITPDGRGLSKVWVNREVASTYSQRLSTRTGLVYTESRKLDEQTGEFVYYLTALDYRTGKTVWEKRLGTGFWFDGYYPGVEFGLDGTVYMVVYGGIVAVKDSY